LNNLTISYGGNSGKATQSATESGKGGSGRAAQDAQLEVGPQNVPQNVKDVAAL
jgi:hypothetical protein